MKLCICAGLLVGVIAGATYNALPQSYEYALHSAKNNIESIMIHQDKQKKSSSEKDLDFMNMRLYNKAKFEGIEVRIKEYRNASPDDRFIMALANAKMYGGTIYNAWKMKEFIPDTPKKWKWDGYLAVAGATLGALGGILKRYI